MSDKGDASVTAEMVAILREILDEQKGMREEQRGMHEEQKATNARLDATNAKLDALHEDVMGLHAGQTSIVNELRGLRGEAGADVTRLKERVEKLEAAVFLKPTRPGRRAVARR